MGALDTFSAISDKGGNFCDFCFLSATPISILKTGLKGMNLQSDQNHHWAHFGYPMIQDFHVDNEDSDQNVQMYLSLHYENTPIQIYRKFLLQKLRIFR